MCIGFFIFLNTVIIFTILNVRGGGKMGCHVHACVGMAFEITSVHVEHKEVVILKMKREEQTSGNAYIY